MSAPVEPVTALAAGLTMADAADVFLVRLAADIGLPDIGIPLLRDLYGPYIMDLVEPTRVKHAVYQRVGRPYRQMRTEQRPADSFYSRMLALTEQRNSPEYGDFLISLRGLLNDDRYTPYHTAIYYLHAKLVREDPDATASRPLLEVGFTAARLLSDLPQLSELTAQLNGTYSVACHAYLSELFDVAYDILRPGKNHRLSVLGAV